MAKIPYFDPRDLDYNPLINSNFDFWQRVLGNTTNLTTVEVKISDRHYAGAVGPTAKSVNVIRSTNVPPSKFLASFSSQLTNNTAVPSLAAADYLYPLFHPIEGTMWRPLANDGFTVGFWLFASVAGNYTVALRRNGAARNYITSVAVTVPNTWQYYVVHIPLDTTGPAQVVDTNRGMDLTIGAIAGVTNQAASLNVWANGSSFSHASATNWAATVGAVIRVAQMNIKKGFRSVEDMRDGYKMHGASYQEELTACQRYFHKTGTLPGLEWLPGVATNAGRGARQAIGFRTTTDRALLSENFPTTMRVAPTVIFYPGRDDVANTASRLALYNGANIVTFLQGFNPGNDSIHGEFQSISIANESYVFQYTADADF